MQSFIPTLRKFFIEGVPPIATPQTRLSVADYLRLRGDLLEKMGRTEAELSTHPVIGRTCARKGAKRHSILKALMDTRCYKCLITYAAICVELRRLDLMLDTEIKYD